MVRFAKESIVKVPVHFHFRCHNERRVASRITVTNCGNEDRAAGGCASLASKYARQKRSCRTPKLRGTRSLITRLARPTSQPCPQCRRSAGSDERERNPKGRTGSATVRDNRKSAGRGERVTEGVSRGADGM